MELIFSFDICAFFLSAFCMIYELSKHKARTRQNAFFLLLVGNIVIGSVFNIVSNLIQYDAAFRHAENRQLLYVSLMFYLLIHNVLPATYIMYVRCIIGLDANVTHVKEVRFLAPAIFQIIVVLTNPITNRVFTVDENLHYIRGPLIYILYAISMVYLLLGLYYIIRYHVALHRRVMLSLYVYYALTICGVAIQLFSQRMQAEMFFEALSLLGLMLVFEEDDIMHDPVTGLYNHMAFRQDITRLLATRQPFYCVDLRFLNLRFYARVMDIERYHRLLTFIAEWVRSLRRNSNFYYFNDDFVMLLFNAEEDDVHTLIWNMRKKLDEPFSVEGIEAQLQSYISIAKAPEDVKNPDDVLDLLEYEPERLSAQVTVQYREALSYIRRESAVERAMRGAVAHRSFQVYYQPIYNCDTGRIVSAEALVRMFDDELGNVSPGEFIPIAEKSALIVEIGNIVFEKVCRFLHEQHPETLGVEYIEVNLSVAQFMQSNLVDRFAEIIRQYDVPARRINLEITESVASDTSEPFMLAIRQLENMGFSFSMDDYGTGYSNISSILNVNFTNIKMDKSFLGQALDHKESASILRDTTQLIRNLGRNVLQEGVESREELNFVQEAGCNLIQGYYFARPLPEADFLEYVRTFNQGQKVQG